MYFQAGIKDALDIVRAYAGGEVTRNQAEAALDFYIMIEPEPGDLNSALVHADHQKKFKVEIEKADKILRQYGEQISPRTLSAMQDHFYSFSNSNKYRYSAETISVVRTELSGAWNGLNGWRD